MTGQEPPSEKSPWTRGNLYHKKRGVLEIKGKKPDGLLSTKRKEQGEDQQGDLLKYTTIRGKGIEGGSLRTTHKL